MAMNPIMQGFLAKNILVIDGEVGKEMFQYVKEAIATLYAIKNSPDITLLISSNGGSVDWGLNTYDLLAAYPGKKIGVIQDNAASMAAVILQACEIRMSTLHGKIMIHHISRSDINLDTLRNDKKIKQWKKEMEEKQLYIYNILAKRTKQSLSRIREECKKDEPMPASKALTFGLIDKIFTGQLLK